MSVEQRSPAEAKAARPAPAPEAGPPVHALTDDQIALLEERKQLAWAAQHAYYERAGILGKLNYWIGVPVVIVTAIAGSAIVANHSGDNPIPGWIGVITVSAAVLASLQTFFRFGERAAFSAVAGNRYGLLRRRIEDCLAAPPEGLDDRLTEIRKLEDDAGDQSPPLGERRWLRWQAFAELPTPPTSRERWSAVVRPSGARRAGHHAR
jgi:hypothetical protein